MSLIQLRAEHVRCLEQIELEPAANNLILGENASGKTSLLEAIFILGRGRSFRGSGRNSVISDGADGLMIAGQIGRDGRQVPVGVAVNRQGPTVVRIDGEPASGLASLAEWVPVQIIDPEIHSLVDEGPGVRRRFMDWGVFHVEHGFLDVWRKYQRSMRQRNAALRGGAAAEIASWDEQLVESGTALTSMRDRYLEDLRPFVDSVSRNLLEAEPTLEYRKGWPASRSLAEALEDSRERDARFGVTHVGAHRSDLSLHFDERAARGRVSRGQQKLLAATLILGQVRHLIDKVGLQPILLLDDLPAELDRNSLARVLAEIRDLDAQIFVTALEADGVELPEPLSVFHVEQGKVQTVL